MMKTERILVLVASAVLLMTAVAPVMAGNGSGSFRVGFVSTDEEGNLAVNEATNNTYEGVAFSLEDLMYRLDNGISISADLRDVTMNNRNISARVYRSGLFDLSVRNNQYRRIYSSDGNLFTRRASTHVKASLQPHKNLRFFGGYNSSDKHGQVQTIFKPVYDTIMSSTDYLTVSYSGGAQAYCSYGSLRVEYRRFDFFDDLNVSNDRTSDMINVSLFSQFPNYDRLTVSGGYIHRTDEMYDYSVKQTSGQFWSGLRLNLDKQISLKYRLLLANVEEEVGNRTTDHSVHTFSIGKAWQRKAGLRLGYSTRTADNVDQEVSGNTFSLQSWANFENGLNLKGKFSTRTNEVQSGVVLLGDESFTRYHLGASYSGFSFGDVSGKYESKSRENDDLNSKVDYDAYTIATSFISSDYGRLQLRYSYYLGQHENTEDNLSYEFADNVLSAELYPNSIGELEVSAGVGYYRGHRDNDIEKFNWTLRAMYDFGIGHRLSASYSLFTYDDFMSSEDFYTGNIFKINLIKDLNL